MSSCIPTFEEKWAQLLAGREAAGCPDLFIEDSNGNIIENDLWWVYGRKFMTQIAQNARDELDQNQIKKGPIMTDFVEFPKMARLRRDCIITEKIDGTNACIRITEDGLFLTGSRSRWITPSDDNYGFSRWAHDNKEQLLQLGVGLHFGEWWGSGCQRGYGLQKGEKRWSLFNVARWCLAGEEPQRIPTADPRIEKYQDKLPECCSLRAYALQRPI